MQKKRARLNATAQGAAALALVVGLMVPASHGASAAATKTGPWTISTVAGTGDFLPPYGDGGRATEAHLANPFDVAGDHLGNFYIADAAVAGGGRIRKVDSAGTITIAAGGGTPASGNGDDGPATEASLSSPQGVAVDAAGNIYIAETAANRIRKVDSSGTITTVAGNGSGGYSGDGGPATSAQLSTPQDVALDAGGNLYIADFGNARVRKVDPSGVITTIAGDGTFGYGGDGGPAASSQVSPSDAAVDAAGNVYIADHNDNRVRKVDAAGTITTVAGNGTYGYSGDGGPATAAALQTPYGVAADPLGNVYIADLGNSAIRRVDALGTISTVAGTGWYGFGGDGGQAVDAKLFFPDDLDIDPQGNLRIAESHNNRIRRVPTSPLWVTTSDNPRAGAPFTYTVRIGPLATPATAVTLRDTLPAKVAFRQARPSQGTCSQDAGKVTCRLGSLTRGQLATVTIGVQGLSSGVATNLATLRAKEPAAIPYGASVATPTKVSGAGCGTVLTASTTLTDDVGPCAAQGLIIGADGITVDLGGHRVYGWPRPPGYETPRWTEETVGVAFPARSGVTLKRGSISGFDAGVFLRDGGGNTLTRLTVRDNVGPDHVSSNPVADFGDGIYLQDSANNLIAQNHLLRNGRYDGIGVWGGHADGNVIRDNRVEDTVGPADGGPAGQGIIVNGADDNDPGQTIEGTQIVANTVLRSASAGIANSNHIKGLVSGNTVEGSGRTNSVGNGIGVQLGPGVPAELKATGTQLLIEDNEVHGNGVDGIRVNSTGNTIRNNNAADNNTNPAVNWYEIVVCDPRCPAGAPGFDLHDASPICDANVWTGNRWGSGFFVPTCTTTDGGGPAPPDTLAEAAPLPEPPALLRPSP